MTRRSCFVCSLLLPFLAVSCGAPEPGPSLAALAGLDPDHACPPVDFGAEIPVTVEEILYDVEEGEELYADLLLPEIDGELPGIVMVHGGGWTRGNRGYLAAAAQDYAEAGFAVLNIEYRLVPGVKHVGQVRDLQCAVSRLRAHDRVDDQCVGILGASAGGHLTALAVLGVGDPLFDGVCDDAEDIEPITRFAMPYYAILDPAVFGDEGFDVIMDNWAGEGITSAELSAVERAPDRLAVPFFLAHGTADDLVPPEQSLLFEEASPRARELRLELVEGGPHGFVEGGYFGHHNQSVQPAAEAFVTRALQAIGR